MPSRTRTDAPQLALFDEPPVRAVVTDEDRDVAARLPPELRFGTSSWTFPGWAGFFWAGRPSAKELGRTGLPAYASNPLFQAVSVDRGYYEPLEEPVVRALADGLPPTFRLVPKVWEELTTAVWPSHARYGDKAGTRAEAFLDPRRIAEEIALPWRRGAEGRLGPLLLQLTPMPRGAVAGPELVRRVEAVRGALPEGTSLAVELRNAELFVPRLVDAFAAMGVALVYTWWTGMPDLAEQHGLRDLAKDRADAVVVRLMLPPYTRYGERVADMSPFDRLHEVRDDLREHAARIALDAAARGKATYVLVNNKAEGSAPLTVRAVAARTAALTSAAPERP